MPTRLLKRVKRWLRPPPVDVRSGRFVAVIESADAVADVGDDEEAGA